ncbi:hypothetical protein K4K55_010199 [Colletotrichum sp. SAR 10_96]|nr:hypothetical protein K4K55_010199 [Colletotrichum sp. SAR 10_96]
MLRRVVLIQAAYPFDEEAFVKIITNGAFSSYAYLVAVAIKPDDGRLPPLLDVFKLIVSVHDIYDARLREEDLQTPVALAKEIVRSGDQKAARRNARLIIQQLERISPEELAQMERDEDNAINAIWKRVSHPPPAWVRQIADAQQSWGFVFYRSREVERKYGHMWDEVWDAIQENSRRIPHPVQGERSHEYALLHSIHCAGEESTLRRLWRSTWATGLTSKDLPEDDALRRHFKDFRELLSSSGILRNTFIMIDDECIPEDLWRYPGGPSAETFWVWAYDAGWKPAFVDTIVYNGEEYRGRVKVPFYCLDAWFYAARYEGVSLRDMWLKAQTHRSKWWICCSKPMENWGHESYI